jgi:hypothetical protein
VTQSTLKFGRRYPQAPNVTTPTKCKAEVLHPLLAVMRPNVAEMASAKNKPVATFLPLGQKQQL